MRQLRDDTHLILDGEVRLYRRERSKRWQTTCPNRSPHNYAVAGHTNKFMGVCVCKCAQHLIV